MKVLLENFAENIRDQLSESDQLEHYDYKQKEQEKQEDELRNAVIKKQQGFSGKIFFQRKIYH
jgi:hypothetical protein